MSVSFRWRAWRMLRPHGTNPLACRKCNRGHGLLSKGKCGSVNCPWSVVSHGGEGVEGLAPFYVVVGDVQAGVEVFEVGVEAFVVVLLPLGGGGVAEEDAA